MNFVKTSVYHQEFTIDGVREKETDARDSETLRREERLKQLPEFNRDPNFRSLSEQLCEGNEEDREYEQNRLAKEDGSTEKPQHPYAPASVTEDEFEFYESLRSKEREISAARAREEQAAFDEFHKARKHHLQQRTGIAGKPSTSTSGGSSPSKLTCSGSVTSGGSGSTTGGVVSSGGASSGGGSNSSGGPYGFVLPSSSAIRTICETGGIAAADSANTGKAPQTSFFSASVVGEPQPDDSQHGDSSSSGNKSSRVHAIIVTKKRKVAFPATPEDGPQGAGTSPCPTKPHTAAADDHNATTSSSSQNSSGPSASDPPGSHLRALRCVTPPSSCSTRLRQVRCRSAEGTNSDGEQVPSVEQRQENQVTDRRGQSPRHSANAAANQDCNLLGGGYEDEEEDSSPT